MWCKPLLSTRLTLAVCRSPEVRAVVRQRHRLRRRPGQQHVPAAERQPLQPVLQPGTRDEVIHLMHRGGLSGVRAGAPRPDPSPWEPPVDTAAPGDTAGVCSHRIGPRPPKPPWHMYGLMFCWMHCRSIRVRSGDISRAGKPDPIAAAQLWNLGYPIFQMFKQLRPESCRCHTSCSWVCERRGVSRQTHRIRFGSVK